MATKTITKDYFNYKYRADCVTDKKYVGTKRKTQSEAEDDKQKHLSIPGNEDHDVKIEVTQMRIYLI
jgi:hypothetical protein